MRRGSGGSQLALGASVVSQENPWRCGVCQVSQVVPSLARECEARHAAESR